MLDFNNIPQNIDKQIFNANGSTWQTWTKPKGYSFAYIVCIGGGGGGGGGFNSPSLTSKSGGGGGGSSAITIAQVPFYTIPDSLYVQVGVQGLGGAAGNPASDGTDGGISYVSLYPSTNMSDCLVVSSLAVAGKGGQGTSTSGTAGTGATALSASATNNPRYLSLCNWSSYAGQNGTAGNAGGTTSLTLFSNLILTGGIGGGGANASNGGGTSGSINTGDSLASFLKTVSGSASFGTAGLNGYFIPRPFVSSGASAGNGSPTGNSGANIGGNASFGSGGGGGGGAVVGGKGGNGGDGLVMIISY